MASAIDEDTVQTVQSGRATLGAMLRSAQVHLRCCSSSSHRDDRHDHGTADGVWDTLRADLLYSRWTSRHRRPRASSRSRRRRDLLSSKKAVIGILMSSPLLIYFGRDGLRQRGWWPAEHIPTWKGSLFVTISLGLFFGGVAYACELFFPLVFNFLAVDAVRQASRRSTPSSSGPVRLPAGTSRSASRANSRSR